ARPPIAVIAPEPAPWLGPLLRQLAAVPGRPPVALFAPWALSEGLGALAPLLPGGLGQALRRRTAPAGVALRAQPGWPVLEPALRLWSRGRTDRQMDERFALRRAADLWAARALEIDRTALSEVVAPSCAARAVFAAARAAGAKTTLVQDLPLIRR